MKLRIVYFIAILFITVVMRTPTIMAQPNNDAPTLTIIADALNVRQGPGIVYPAVAVLQKNFVVTITGQDSVSGWWQISLPDGRTGWITGVSTYVTVNGDTTGVPNVSPPTLVTQPETVTAPASIPGAGTLVFQTSSGGPIYAVNANGTNLRYLTTGIDPAISPDGQWVAFTRWDSPAFEGLGSLWVINIDGTGERSVLGGIVGHPKSPTWSPDGQALAFSSQLAGGHPTDVKICGKTVIPPKAFDIEWVEKEAGGYLCYKLPPESFWGLRMVDVATGTTKDLPSDTHAFSPTWNPAVPWQLIYAGERGLSSLDINQGVAQLITADVLDHSPVFSPDGTRLAVTYLQNNNWDIHVLNVDGTGRARLTETPLINIVEQRLAGEEPHIWNNVSATWSPDGTRLAFISDRNGPWEIWLMNADGSNQHPLFEPGMPNGIELQYHSVDERVISWGP